MTDPPRFARTEIHETASVEETMEVAERLATTLSGGAVVHLHGQLGAGKTHFVKGLARGLLIHPDAVVSPTFTLVQPHSPRGAAGLGLVHVDLYRIADPAELVELGLDELPGRGSIAAVEWAERLGDGGRPGHLRVTIEDLGGDRRRIEIAFPPDDGEPPRTIV